MKTFTAVAIGLLLAFSHQSLGYDTKGPWTKVKQVYVGQGDSSPFVYFHAGAMPGCYGDNGGYLKVLGEDRSNKLHSVILAALLADRDVRVYYNYTGSTEGWGMCHIEAVYIR